MSKAKGQPKNFLRYFLDEFILFRRDFFYEPQLAPELVAKRLDKLDYEFKGMGQRKRRIQAHVAKVDNQWHFEMNAEQPVTGKNRKHHPSGYRPSASANGIIYADDDGKTFVEGTVVVNGLQFWAGLLVSLLILTIISVFVSEFAFVFVVFLLGMGFFWFQMYQDRNHLASLVEQAIKSANERIYE